MNRRRTTPRTSPRYVILSELSDAAVLALAGAESRTLSAMIKLLVEEALAKPERLRQLGELGLGLGEPPRDLA